MTHFIEWRSGDIGFWNQSLTTSPSAVVDHFCFYSFLPQKRKKTQQQQLLQSSITRQDSDPLRLYYLISTDPNAIYGFEIFIISILCLYIKHFQIIMLSQSTMARNK